MARTNHNPEARFPILTKKTPAFATSEALNNIEAQIRLRAYELYEIRGREDGHDLEDWLRAEAEIMGSVIEEPRPNLLTDVIPLAARTPPQRANAAGNP